MALAPIWAPSSALCLSLTMASRVLPSTHPWKAAAAQRAASCWHSMCRACTGCPAQSSCRPADCTWSSGGKRAQQQPQTGCHPPSSIQSAGSERWPPCSRTQAKRVSAEQGGSSQQHLLVPGGCLARAHQAARQPGKARSRIQVQSESHLLLQASLQPEKQQLLRRPSVHLHHQHQCVQLQ